MFHGTYDARLERRQAARCFVAALFLTYVVFAAASMRVAIRAREVIVPALAVNR